jgi:mannosyltransferase
MTVGIVGRAQPETTADVSAPEPPRRRLRTLLPALGPGTAMLVLGGYGVTHRGLRSDEVATVEVASRSFGRIVETAGTIDAVLLPYYLFMHVWTALFGVSELAVRAPSVIAMAGAVGLTGELGRRLSGPVTGGLAGALLLLVPQISRYAQEARPYAISCLFAVLATLLLFRALDRPSGRAWAAYGVVVLLLGASHLVALTVVGGHAVAVVRQARGDGVRRTWPWLAAVAAAGAALLPLAMLGAGQRGTQLHWVDPLTAATAAALPGDLAGSPDTGWLLAGMALLGVRRRPGRLIDVAGWLVVPPAVVGLVSVLAEPLWVPRYLLCVLPAAALLAAVAVTGPGRRSSVARVLLVLLVVAVTAYPEHRRIRSPHPGHEPDYRAVADLVRRAQQPGDGIVYQGGWSRRAGVEYYLRGAADRPADVLLHRPAADLGGLVAAEKPDPAAHVGRHTRVWLVVGGRHADPAVRKPVLTSLLHTRYDRAGLWHPGGTTVALYQRRT